MKTIVILHLRALALEIDVDNPSLYNHNFTGVAQNLLNRSENIHKERFEFSNRRRHRMQQRKRRHVNNTRRKRR